MTDGRQTIMWGKYPLSHFEKNLHLCYSEVIKWKKNLFLLPSGRAGKGFIIEIKRLVDLFVNKTPYYKLALNALMVMVPLLLQKPSKNSKSSDHVKYLEKRLALWSEGEILVILRECRKIQDRLINSKRKDDPDKARKVFVRLMLQGKDSSALRWLDSQCSTSSLEVDENIINKLKEKHPPAQPSSENDFLHGPQNKVEHVIYDEIDGHSIYRAAITTKGSGGPTAVDADAWKRFLCSKSFGNASKDLCDSVACLARNLCTDFVPPEALKYFVSGRLIALDKAPGEHPIQIRPIGVGEVLRRIVGKSIMLLLKADITHAAGPLQACAGHKGGVEAAVHAMKKVFEDPKTEAVLLVDASNAFNSMNRGTALHNIQVICPEMATFLINTYREPPSLYVANSNGVKIMSEEGCTQGDNAGMSFYACNTIPLISLLQENSSCQQEWFADDSAAAGTLEGIREWWNCLNRNGPTMGYYPNAGKTWLILKNKDNTEKANEVFEGTNINITVMGKKHLGACIGSPIFKQQYITAKVDKWVKQLRKLIVFAKTDPHAAYAAFTFGFMQRWKYTQRTVQGIADLFQPLEDCIQNEFLPAIIGKSINSHERAIFSLPTRFGGLNIPNPVHEAENEYEWSLNLNRPLMEKIMRQQLADFQTPVEVANGHKECVNQMKSEKNQLHKNSFTELYQISNEGLKRSLTLASEKGSSIWLNTLPLESHSYALNKQEFHDAISLRYNFKVAGVASHCACGVQNSVDHALTCMLGGYTHMRHNEVRDTQADLLREVCRDVQVEPSLIPLSGQQFSRSSNHESGARLDISARGLWNPMERAFLDVRIFHPNAPSNRSKSLPQLYASHENEKKRTYNDRIIQVEHGTFTPLFFSTSGGESPECRKYHQRLATLISERRKESYAETMTYIRRRMRFCILRTTLVSVRGYRKPKNSNRPVNISFSETDISVSEMAHRF